MHWHRSTLVCVCDVSRYRAPEVLCSWRQYDEQVDVWSVGCILAELMGYRPLFQGMDTHTHTDTPPCVPTSVCVCVCAIRS